jgi:hypothetical protein
MLSIATVNLPANDVPPAALKNFYVGLLGLTFDGPLPDGGLAFRHGPRQVRLLRDASPDFYRRLGLAVRRFDKALQSLRNARIRYELHHTDGGLSRWLLLNDPAENWIYLHETRPF